MCSESASTDSYTEKAYNYYRDESYDISMDFADKALDEDPKDAEALLLKGKILIKKKKFDEAIDIFEDYLSNDNKNVGAWKGKGLAYFMLNKPKEAAECYEKALDIDSVDAEANYYMGQALMKMGGTDRAEKFVEKAVSLDSSYAYEKGSVGRDIVLDADRPDYLTGGGKSPPGVRIDLTVKGLSTDLTLPGGAFKSKSIAIPGRAMTYTIEYEYKNAAGLPAGTDLSRDLVITTNHTAKVATIDDIIEQPLYDVNPSAWTNVQMIFVSSSLEPDYGTNNRWTIHNILPGKKGLINITVIAPEIENAYIGPEKFDWDWVAKGQSENKIKIWQDQFDRGTDSPSIGVLIGSPQLSLSKSASSETIAPGGIVTYTLTYGNMGGNGVDLIKIGEAEIDKKNGNPMFDSIKEFIHDGKDFEGNWTRDLTLVEDYPPGMTFISSSLPPDEGTNNRWTITDLSKGENGTINVTLRAPPAEAQPNIKFGLEESSSGVGFMRSSSRMTTETHHQPYILRNTANISFLGIYPENATSSVAVVYDDDHGTEIQQRESGSGSYSSEETLTYDRDKKSIHQRGSLSTSYSPTHFSLPGERGISYSSMWESSIETVNGMTREKVEESYLYTSRIDREGYVTLNKDGTQLGSETNFEGMRHTDYLKESNTTSKGRRSVIQEISEDYVGIFDISEKLGSSFFKGPRIIPESALVYDDPHISIYQEGGFDPEETSTLYYIVSVVNDGNRDLGPIYVMDEIPSGTSLLNASIPPDTVYSGRANWRLEELPRGGYIAFYLALRVDGFVDNLINCVSVTAGDGDQVSAFNCTPVGPDWLGCNFDGSYAWGISSQDG
jgi:uncharacterized repeat protein (TIGR01451 family)